MKANNNNRLKNFFLYLGLFLVLAFLSLVITLRVGVNISRISLGNMEVIDSFIQWKQGLNFEAKQLILKETKDDSRLLFKDFREVINSGFTLLKYIDTFTSSLRIFSLETDLIKGDIQYSETQGNTQGHIRLESDDFQIISNISKADNNFLFQIETLELAQYESSVTGKILLDSRSGRLDGDLFVNIAKTVELELGFATDYFGLSFIGITKGDITQIQPVVDLFDLDPDITPWIVDYTQGSRFNLQTIQGKIPWENPASLLTSLYVKGRVDDSKYTFAEGFDPVIADYTEVVFENGALKIFPHNATFYGQKCGTTSWVDIDFYQPLSPILTVYLRTNAALNEDLLRLISYYDIDIPLQQIDGTTKTDLTFAIDLQEEEVNAVGKFTIGKGVISYLGQNLIISGGEVQLRNSTVRLGDIQFSINDILDAKVSGKVNIIDQLGSLEFEVERTSFPVGENQLHLVDMGSPLLISYEITPDGDNLQVRESTWEFMGNHIEVGEFSAPFDYDTLQVVFPPTLVHVREHNARSVVSGTFGYHAQNADLVFDILEYNNNKIELTHPHWIINATYNDVWTLSSGNTAHWSINGTNTTFSELEATVSPQEFLLTNTHITAYDSIFKTDIEGIIDIKNGVGTLYLKNIFLETQSLGTLFHDWNEIKVDLGSTEAYTLLDVPQLHTEIQIDNEIGWSVVCENIEPIFKRSPFLKKYKISQGIFSIGSPDNRFPFAMSGEIVSPRKLLVSNDSLQDAYVFHGELNQDGFSGVINDSVTVKYHDAFEIKSTDIEYNVGAIIQLLEDINETESGTTNLDFRFLAEKTGLYVRAGNRALADILYITIQDGKTLIQLEHESGKAWFNIKDQNVSFSGANFGEKFLEGLLRQSRFDGGQLSFSGKGTLTNFTTLFQLKDTVLVDYQVTNNIFAFVDTIPALMTFSLPDYSSRGMDVSSGFLTLEYKQGLFNIDTFAIDSKTLDMHGYGTVDPRKDTIDMDINLITTAKDNISKIPLVGYVLVGDKKLPSITLKVSGQLANPKVKSSVFKDYVAWPVETVFRAITLPFGVLESILSGDKRSRKKPQDSFDGPFIDESSE